MQALNVASVANVLEYNLKANIFDSTCNWTTQKYLWDNEGFNMQVNYVSPRLISSVSLDFLNPSSFLLNCKLNEISAYKTWWTVN